VFGAVEGVIRTRVGYCGGTLDNPEYHDLGDHTETIEMEYDPTVVSLDKLLNIFWESHCSTFDSGDTQYMSAIFYHDDSQKQIAERSMKDRSAKIGNRLYTKINPYNMFTLAEDYHQKFYLRQVDNCKELLNIKTDEELIHSSIATKLNAYIAGHGNYDDIQQYVLSLNISDQAKKIFLTKLARVHQISAKKIGH